MSKTDKLNKAGYCILCDAPIFKAASLYPTGHLLQGRLRTVKRSLPCAREIYLQLLDSSFTVVTACDKCAEGWPQAGLDSEALHDIHEIILNSWHQELLPEYREAIGAQPLSKIRYAHQQAWLLKQMDNIILDVTGVYPLESTNG